VGCEGGRERREGRKRDRGGREERRRAEGEVIQRKHTGGSSGLGKQKKRRKNIQDCLS
jgi:hypothetical protein